MLYKSFKIVLICILLFAFVAFVFWTFEYSISSKSNDVKLVMSNGKVVGAATLGAKFDQNNYFWGRLSASDFQVNSKQW